MNNKIEKVIIASIAILIAFMLSFYSWLIFTSDSKISQNTLTYSIDPSTPNAKSLSDLFLTLGYKPGDKNSTIIVSSIKPNGYNYIITAYTKYFVLDTSFKKQGSSLSIEEYNSLLNSGDIYTNSDLSSIFPKAKIDNSNSLDKIEIESIDDITSTKYLVPIDNQTPFDKSFDNKSYPLKDSWSIYSKESIPDKLISSLNKISTSNIDSTNIHTIFMTGTTAFGRGEFFAIRAYGANYPSEYVKDIFKGADIVHVSDETSFVPDCTQQVGTLKFCAPMQALDTLKSIGVNLVELTGNHNNDFGSNYNLNSQKIYTQNNINFFGGGDNAQDASKPAYFELNGTKIAFLGYNQPGPTYAFAGDNSAGAAKLNVDQMVSDIKSAKLNASLVFVDIQWENENNQYPEQFQIDSAHAAIDAGASVVEGSQAHRPEGMEFYKNGTIFYGLGNLFFDQMENLDTRQAFILKYTLYKDKIVDINMIPTLLYNYSQPKPATGQDAQDIYNEVWQASTNVF